MKNTYIILSASIVIAGFLFNYFEMKKTHQLIETLLLSVRELRASSYPNKNEVSKTSNKTITHSQYNNSKLSETSNKSMNHSQYNIINNDSNNGHEINDEKDDENSTEVDNIQQEIYNYQKEINRIDKLIYTSDSETEPEISLYTDVDSINREVNKNINPKLYSQEDKLSDKEDQISIESSSEYELNKSSDINIDKSSYSNNNELQDNSEENEEGIELQDNSEEDEEGIELQNNSVGGEEDNDIQDDTVENEESNNIQDETGESKELIYDNINKEYTVKSLKNLCRDNYVKISGTKQQLIDRLLTKNMNIFSNNKSPNIGLNASF